MNLKKNPFQLISESFNGLPYGIKILVSFLLLLLALFIIALIYVGSIGSFVNNNSDQNTDTTLLIPSQSSVSASVEEYKQKLPENIVVKDKFNPINGSIMNGTDYDNMISHTVVTVSLDIAPGVGDNAGIVDADQVFEFPMEGGTARLMGVYWSKNPALVGPVRSARNYFVDMTQEFNAVLAHYGQARADIGFNYTNGDKAFVDTLSYLGQPGIKHTTCSVERKAGLSALGIPVEHTYYSSLNAIRSCMNSEWDIKPDIYSYKYKDDLAQDQRPGISELNVNRNDKSFSTTWIYLKDQNSYKRVYQGKDSVDRETKALVTAKNIVVQYVKSSIVPDPLHHVRVETVGSGKGLVMIDGNVKNITWTKSGLASRVKFFDSEGKEFEFNRGQLWVVVIPVDKDGKTINSSVSAK